MKNERSELAGEIGENCQAIILIQPETVSKRGAHSIDAV